MKEKGGQKGRRERRNQFMSILSPTALLSRIRCFKRYRTPEMAMPQKNAVRQTTNSVYGRVYTDLCWLIKRPPKKALEHSNRAPGIAPGDLQGDL